MPKSVKFGRILVAFDGSSDSVKAIQMAAGLSGEFESEVTILHVYRSPAIALSAASGMPSPDYRDMEDAAKEAGQKVLSRGLQLAKDAGVNARGELIEASSVVEAIVEFAARQRIDLVITGTRGMTGFKKLLLGSVSSGLVSHAPCPVLVVR